MAELKQKVNPFAIGGAFVEYCVSKKWLKIEMDEHQIHYYITPEGEEALKNEFGIILTSCAKIKD